MTRSESSYKLALCVLFVSACLLAGGGMKTVFAAADLGAVDLSPVDLSPVELSSVAPGVSVAPGAVGGEAAEPTVISASPGNWATDVPTSINTRENVVTGTGVTATFSQRMDPATVNSLTFTVKETTGDDVAGTVAMNAAHTEATFTPSSASLNPNTGYTATITTAARNAGGVAMAHPITWSFTTNAVRLTGQKAVNLGGAGVFAILTKSGITDVFASTVVGDVGTSPITGAAIHLTCTEVTGTIYSVNAAGPLPCRVTDPSLLTTAVSNMQTAYTDAAGRTNPNFLNLGAGQIGGLTLAPGLYKWTTSVLISTNVTLSGGSNAVWIFQISGKLTQANATKMILAGGALPKNIFWQTSDAVSIGTTAQAEGVILSKTMIAMKTGASAHGRLLAQTAVTLQQNAVTQPTH
jgi:hypothetical protein